MPTDSIVQGATVNGEPVAQFGASPNTHQLLTDLFHDTYGFKGIILSDWGIMRDCTASAVMTEIEPLTDAVDRLPSMSAADEQDRLDDGDKRRFPAAAGLANLERR